MFFNRLKSIVQTSVIANSFSKGLGATVGVGAGITVAETLYGFLKIPINKVQKDAGNAGKAIFDSKPTGKESVNKP